jgi:hypothetical protein
MRRVQNFLYHPHILSKTLESQIEEVIEGQSGFQKGKGTRDANELMRIISERLHHVNQLSACVVVCRPTVHR